MKQARSSSKRIFFWCLLFLTSACVAVGIAEMSALIIVHKVLNQGRMFEVDEMAGWKTRSNLNLERTTPSGKLWHIHTDNRGYRTSSTFAQHASKRILILGDSYAFGYGIDIENRFDMIMTQKRPDWSIVNLGVHGYGTDQQFIVGRKYFEALRKGDILILLTHANDYSNDILRQSLSGRPKPWFELKGDTLVEHPPRMGFFGRARDKSYLLSRILIALEDYSFSADDVKRGLALYSAIAKEKTSNLVDKGVFVLVAYHGHEELCSQISLDPNIITNVFRNLSFDGKIECISLDRVLQLSTERANFISNDIHWHENGHRVVAETLLDYFNDQHTNGGIHKN